MDYIVNHESAFIRIDRNEDLFSSSELNKQLKKFGAKSNTSDNFRKACEKYIHRKNSLVPVLIFGSHYIARDVFDIFEFPFDSGII